jgi:asparagine synthase (glutamine-hydrolysing)
MTGSSVGQISVKRYEAFYMCGIAGHIDFAGDRSASANEHLAQTMSDAIRHRGPDSAGVKEALPGVWLAFRRLAIVDVTEAGNQPMSTPDGLGHIIHNGEAYNAAELRPALEAAGYRFRGHSDTEVILYGCRQWGVEETARRLIGMFAFAYVDTKARTLSIVRDRLGKKPLYWFSTERSFAFGSELKAITRHPDCPREIDRSSLAEFLRLLYIPAPHSIYAGVHKLEPGAVLDFARGSRTGESQSISRHSLRRSSRSRSTRFRRCPDPPDFRCSSRSIPVRRH